MGKLQLTANEAFNRFWAAYPKRVARLDALKAWNRLNPSPLLVEEIMTALAWQREQESWQRDEGQYVPYPASWIRSERWTDEPVKPIVKPVERYWYDECLELHGGICDRQWTHAMKMRSKVQSA